MGDDLNRQPPTSASVKQQVRRWLDCGREPPEEWCAIPVRKAINALFPYLYDTDPRRKWNAVRALGHLVARLADDDREAARNIVRRLIWNLNDESGGIGWGAAEAMGEILANHAGLREEYLQILLSYARQDGNLLEHDLLLGGALWGLIRVVETSPDALQGASAHLTMHLRSRDPMVRALAVRLLGLMGDTGVREQLEHLEGDSTEVMLFGQDGTQSLLIRDLVAEALGRLT
ncbi:MAG TPA: hypothetical protein DCE18_15055 [Syntrophobacteraceae bacterium]|nr:hypothetical protein [Syntrophobacteraceae bacterium]